MMFDVLSACVRNARNFYMTRPPEERHTQNASFTTSGDKGPSQDSLKFIQELPPSKIPPMPVQCTISRPTTAKYFAFPPKPTFLDPDATHGNIATFDDRGPTQKMAGSSKPGVEPTKTSPMRSTKWRLTPRKPRESEFDLDVCAPQRAVLRNLSRNARLDGETSFFH